MSLFGDIEEAKNLWNGASWPTKAAIILVTFLSISSITSLSDVVFEWKGFILDAIEFYREWIVNPFRSVATLIGLNYVDIEVDAIVLFSTQMSVQFRSQVVPQKLNLSQLAILLVTIVVMGLGNPGLDAIGISLIATTLLGLTLFAIVSYRTDRTIFIRAFGPVLAAIVIVLLLGAIQEGLLR